MGRAGKPRGEEGREEREQEVGKKKKLRIIVAACGEIEIAKMTSTRGGER